MIEVSVWDLTVASLDPKCTAVASSKLVPAIVTVVPPVAGPVAGDRPVTTGVSPSEVTTLPASSLATQKDADGHDTETMGPS